MGFVQELAQWSPNFPIATWTGFWCWRWYRVREREPFRRKTRKAARTMVGHAIRHELDELEEVIAKAGDETYGRCVQLFRFAAAYVLLDYVEYWPSDRVLERILPKLAHVVANAELRLPVTEPEIGEYLSRVVFGFEPFEEVFPAEKARTVPLYATAAVLFQFAWYTRRAWWDLLDQAWYGVAAAERTKVSVLGGLIIRARAEEHQRTHGREG